MRMICSDYGEWRDALSQDLIDYVHRQGYEPILIPNKPEICTTYIYDTVLLILSGGDDLVLQSATGQSDNPRARRDRTEWNLLATAIANRQAVLGICRGAQFINTYFGGTCAEIPPPKNHVAVEHEIQIASEKLRSLLESRERMIVNSYHRLGIQSMAPELVVAATASDGEIEAIEHPALPVVGVMWHPERKCSDTDFARMHGKLLGQIIDPQAQP